MQNLIERYKLSEEQIKNIIQNQELGENEKVLRNYEYDWQKKRSCYFW